MKTKWLKLIGGTIVFGTGLIVITILIVTRAASASPASSTLNVTTTVDAIDDNPGNGQCHTGANQCSLRAAIMEANKFTTDVTINIPSGVYVLTILPITPTDNITNGDLNLTPPPSGLPIMIINGAGMHSTIIDGNGTDRVFSVTNGRIANFNNLTIRNGHVGQFRNGGGLETAGFVVLNYVRVFNNSAAGGLGGGGIDNNGRLTINSSLIDGNSTADYGGGITNQFYGTLRINDSTIYNNRAPSGTGGGIFDVSAQAVDVQISNTTIYSNYAYSGGGLGRDWNTAGPMRVINSAIYSNTAWGGNGGAIDLASFNGGNLHVINSTISHNSAQKNGGGIAIEKSTSQVYLYNDTLAYNRAGADLTYLGKGGAIASLAGAVFTSQYTIMAWDVDLYSNGVITYAQYNPCYGTFGYEHADIVPQYDGSRCNPTGLYYLGDPMIGPLRNNGGSTWTHAVLPGSPAIDAGLFCSDDFFNTLLTDQRGFARFTDTWCDIGAYEYEDHWTYLPLTLKNH